MLMLEHLILRLEPYLFAKHIVSPLDPGDVHYYSPCGVLR